MSDDDAEKLPSTGIWNVLNNVDNNKVIESVDNVLLLSECDLAQYNNSRGQTTFLGKSLLPAFFHSSDRIDDEESVNEGYDDDVLAKMKSNIIDQKIAKNAKLQDIRVNEENNAVFSKRLTIWNTTDNLSIKTRE